MGGKSGNSGMSGMSGVMGGRRRFNPADYGTVALWLKADSLTGYEDEDVVDTWPDSSGNGNDAIQGTFIKMPLYRTGQIGGGNGVQYDGIDDELLLEIPAPSAAEIFIVYKLQSAGSRGTVYTFGTTDDTHLPYHEDGLLYDDFASTTRKNGISPPVGAAFTTGVIYNARSADGLWVNAVNGQEAFTTGSNVFAWPAQQFLGTSKNKTCFAGVQSEVILFREILTADARAAINQHLSRKYSITLS